MRVALKFGHFTVTPPRLCRFRAILQRSPSSPSFLPGFWVDADYRHMVSDLHEASLVASSLPPQGFRWLTFAPFGSFFLSLPPPDGRLLFVPSGVSVVL